MGRPRNRRNKNTEQGDFGKKQGSYDTIIKQNTLFELYYKQLNLMPESEFDQFLHTLQQPLPLTFRITSYKSYAMETLRIIKQKHFKYLDEVTTENKDEVVEASSKKGASLVINLSSDSDSKIYKCLSWYPNELAWQVNLSRQDVRKNKHFDEFKKFLINQTENGNLSRQEAVSMIPPLLLDVSPEHKVLDMCAAPGSKTAQLIEFLHQDKVNSVPSGLVVANDLENKRCYLLMHQLKRLESPNFMIINHDSSSLPNFRVDLEESASKSVMYDRILADVPCSGDGTFRKNVDIWTKWNFSHACNLHGIQFRIAKRAVELLKPGGLMVYSTCSLNPVENESVVHNLLESFKDQIEIVDARDKLPGLKTVNGLLKWNLMGKKGEIFENFQQIEHNKQFSNLLRPHMFPPEESVAKRLHLDRCIRVLPHHQDTGGFFITLIRKLPIVNHIDLDKEYLSDAKATGQINLPEADATRTMKAPPAKKLKHVYEENPFQFMDLSSQFLQQDWPKV
ncbi:tRNA (cytosine(34)-C(5))-methyltransferase, partial [Brachionus plicatilis]